jgi:hypothetical protein
MKFFIIFIFFLIVVNAARTKRIIETSIDDVFIETRLPKLYTWNYQSKSYKPILNKNGKITKQYQGGIYYETIIQRRGMSPKITYIPVHKPKSLNPKKRSQKSKN